MITAEEAKETFFKQSIALGLSAGFVVTVMLCGIYGEWEYYPIGEGDFGAVRQTHYEFWMYAPLVAGIVLGFFCGFCDNSNTASSRKLRPS